MIFETIISTTDKNGNVNFSPFGIKKIKNFIFISPYVPSKSLNNLIETSHAVVNYTTSSMDFVRCIIGRKKFKKQKCQIINCYYMEDCICYDEVKVVDYVDDKIRPKFKCKIVNSISLKRFQGFNRAQASIVEACILASRVKMLEKKKIIKDLDYLGIAIDKTAGIQEKKAWQLINNYIKDELSKLSIKK